MKFCPVCGNEFDQGELCPQDGSVLIQSQSASEALVGQVLKGSYRLEEKIGEGGMGVVFRGVQMALQRTVAIKVLLPEMRSTPSMIRRFFQEARLLSQLNHPHVVGIIDFGNTETGTLFMVMEYLEGQTLREVVDREGGLPLGLVTRLMEQICAAVGAAHDLELIHRDLKPDNIFIASRQSAPETVKILDFGLARAVAGAKDTRLTQTGLLMGTAGFVAPEQIAGGDSDARSDIYALGSILYFMITGTLAFQGDSLHTILTAQMDQQPKVGVGALGGFPALGGVVSKAMASDPEDRYQSARDLYSALRDAASELDQTLTLGGSADYAQAPETQISPHCQPTIEGPKAQEAPLLSSAGGGEMASRKVGRPAAVGSEPADTPSRMRGVWLAVWGLAVILVLAMGWQWSRGGGSGAAESSDATSVPEEPIVVGMSAAFSGPSRELGRAMQLGIETCFSDVNEQGGVHGRELRLVALDDGYEPARTVANVAELIFERGVVALLGNVGTPTAEVALPLALEQGIPFFGAFTGAGLLRKDPPDRLVFNFRASYAEETRAIIGHFIDDLGMEPAEIAVFAQEDAFGDEGYRGVVGALEERGYTAEVPRFGYRRNTQSIDSAAEGLTRGPGRVRGVVLVATYRAATELIREMREREADLVFAGLSFVGSNAFAQELLELGPDYSEGVIVTQVVPHYEAALPGVAQYRELLAEYFPSERPGFVSLEGYLAARVFVEALQHAGEELSGEAIVNGAESLSSIDLGIGTDVRFGSERHQGSSTVWGTVLDRSGEYRPLALPDP